MIWTSRDGVLMDLPQKMHRDRRDFLDTDKHRFTLFGFTGAFLKTAGRPSQKLLVMRAPGELTIFYFLLTIVVEDFGHIDNTERYF